MKVLYIVTGLFLIFSSCRKPLKEVEEYFPEVEIISATVETDGTVKVIGEVISEGAASIQFLGCSMDTISQPGLLSNQQMATWNGNQFEVIYSGAWFSDVYYSFDPTKTYYFRVWAANDYGYSFGSEIPLSNIEATPVTPPCSPFLNSIDAGGSSNLEYYATIGTPISGISGWEFQAASSSNIISFNFGSQLATGLYTTTSSSSPLADQVKVEIVSGFNSGSLSGGSSVYVNQTSQGVWEVTICDAPWNSGTGTIYLKTKFITQ